MTVICARIYRWAIIHVKAEEDIQPRGNVVSNSLNYRPELAGMQQRSFRNQVCALRLHDALVISDSGGSNQSP